MKQQKTGVVLLLISLCTCIIGLLISQPIIQDIKYHCFSDSTSFFGVNNFWNVISNLPFVLISFWGYFKLKPSHKTPQYLTFIIGIGLIGLGSGYYHFNPSNQTLIWDRLPMTLVFMSLFSIIISEFVSIEIGKKLFIPLLILGLFSIGYWVFSNDLRPYVFVQFFPILAILIILFFFESRHNKTAAYWLLLIAYTTAKAFEHFDQEIHNLLAIISGHSLKHLISVVGLWILLKSYNKAQLKS